MNSFVEAREWFQNMSAKTYAGVLLAAMTLIAFVVFGVLPNQNLLVINAFLSGIMWMICVGVILLGGKRVDAASFCAASLIAAGLSMSIPSIFYEHTPVDWGSTISRLGFAVLCVRWGLELIHKIKRDIGKA